MKKIGILINKIKSFQFLNSMIIANSLKKSGFQVSFCFTESITLTEGNVFALSNVVLNEINEGDELDIESFELKKLTSFDYLWILSFGKKGSFLDYMQILWSIKNDVNFVNSIESLMFMNNKHLLGNYPNIFKHPKTYVSSDFEYLFNVFSSQKNKKWILKPTADSLGRDVYVLKPNDSNVRALLQSMTNNKYCIMQEYINEIKNGEKRVIIANGKPIFQYLRKNEIANEHRTNIHQGATAYECELTKDEHTLCIKVGSFLKDLGANFVGIDLVYPYIVEFNILNPGGLNTIFDITEKDYSHKVIQNIFTK